MERTMDKQEFREALLSRGQKLAADMTEEEAERIGEAHDEILEVFTRYQFGDPEVYMTCATVILGILDESDKPHLILN
jgi:hypothetical protein